MQNLTGVQSAAAAPSAVSDLGLNGSLTPEEIEARKKKLMAAGNADPMARYGDASRMLLGPMSKLG